MSILTEFDVINFGDAALHSSSSSLAAAYAVRSRGGRTRSYSACWTKIRTRVRVLLRIPSFFAKHTQPSVAHLGAKGLDFFSIHITTSAPVLRVLSRLGFDYMRLIIQSLDGRQPWDH